MTPSLDRWKDITLNPCNASVSRRNTAAIREALQALAEQVADITPDESPQAASGTLIFFECTADNVGGATVAIQEVVYNTGTADWDVTGALYTAYDWSERNAFNPNFKTGFRGVGRLNEAIAGDAVEVIAIEGYARIVECTLAENMGASTTKEALSDVDEYWGDTLNGQNPGAQVTLHDVTNMAPNAALGAKAIGVYDEKNQRYVYVGPWNGAQTTGQAAIVRVDNGAGCDVTSQENSYCIHPGRLQTLSIVGDFCAEKFTDGSAVWIIDARQCHTFTRLVNNERYVAVSAGINFDPDPLGPSTDERALYLIVDETPAFRWYRVLTDAESLSLPDAELNNLQCRDHECAGAQPDDAPSTWAIWEDIDPCTRVLETQGEEAILIYFPMKRKLCEAVTTASGVCEAIEANPDCRKNRHVMCMWNIIAERWESIHDVEECAEQQDVSLVVVCDATPNSCCLYDAKRVKHYPRSNSYCDPHKDAEKVWLFCSNATTLTVNWCELAVKICNGLTCNGETRPVYMHRCGSCSCDCPDPGQPIYFKIEVDDDGPCGFIDGVEGEMFCLDTNPIDGGGVQGWYGEFSFTGVVARIVFHTTPLDATTYPNGAWIEVAQYGDTGYSPGDIMSAWDDGGGGAFTEVGIPVANDYEIGMDDCAPLELDGIQQYRVFEYRYALWVECPSNDGQLANAKIYWLKPGSPGTAVNPTCDGGSRMVTTGSAVLTSGENLLVGDETCCNNSLTVCPDDMVMPCDSANTDTEITVSDLIGAGLIGGSTDVSICAAGWGINHIMGGCTCNVVVADTPSCSQNATGCVDHLCFEFSWNAP